MERLFLIQPLGLQTVHRLLGTEMSSQIVVPQDHATGTMNAEENWFRAMILNGH
jgi:hypothetical protein